jgi:hypothetical protein
MACRSWTSWALGDVQKLPYLDLGSEVYETSVPDITDIRRGRSRRSCIFCIATA